MNIQIAQLKYFLALVSTKNYTTAAEQCNVSQPALSMAIRKLEEELDLILIDRKSNPISLTEKGELIASQANKILEEIFIMGKLASELHLDKLNGSLKLTVIPTLASYIMPLFIQLSTRALTDATATGGWAGQLPVVAQFFDFFQVSRHVSLLVACIMAGAALKFATASMKALTNSLKGVGTGAGGSL